MMPSPLPFLARTLKCLLLTACAGLCLPLLQAQPSGGPYGPQRLDYPVPAVQGKIHYVAPEAPAGATGLSPAEACSLEAAIERATGGDAILLRGGTYRTGSLRVNQGVLLQPLGSGEPVLKGTLVATDWIQQKNGLWRTRWTRLFPAKPADWWRRESVGAVTPQHRFNNDMVFVDGRRLRSAGWEGELDDDSFYIDYEKGEVYIKANPRDHLVEITAHDSALVRTITPVHGRVSDGRGLQLKGLTFTQYAYRALEIESREPEGIEDPANYGNEVPGSVLENLTITQCSRVAAYLRGRGLVIRNCLVSDTSTEGLYLIGSCDSLLERNIIARNNVHDLRGYYPSAVKIFNQSHRVVCRDNLVLDNPYSNGIWYDVGNCDGVMVNNWIENCQNGFFFEISKRALAVGNVFVNCDAGVKSLNSCGVEVYHNTFINAPASFERNERGSVADHFGWHPSTGPGVEERDGHAFAGNLVVADYSAKPALLELWQAKLLNAKLTKSQLRQLDGNVYVVLGGTKRNLIDFSPVTGEDRATPLATLDELRTRDASFERSGKFLQVNRGSLFRSVELRDFHPLRSQLPALPAELLAGPLAARVRELLGRSAGEVLPAGAYPSVAP
jgi:hypothetical protein